MIAMSPTCMVVLPLALYRQIYDALGEDRASVLAAQSTFKSVDKDTIESIYRLKWQEVLKRTTHKLLQDANMKKIYQDYLQKSVKSTDSKLQWIIVQMAREYNLPPCFLCRIILKVHYVTSMNGECHDKDDNRMGVFVKRALADPEHILSFDPVLQVNVQHCLQCDDICSPQAELYKQQIGAEKEGHLVKKLREYNIDFIVEKGMRRLGFPKTPDALLSVPIAIDGCVISWIESKAFFGDPHQHDRYLKKQYWAYHNRFGPGLVIYWFGFVRELDNLRQHGILIRSDFPEDPKSIVTIEPMNADARSIVDTAGLVPPGFKPLPIRQ